MSISDGRPSNSNTYIYPTEIRQPHPSTICEPGQIHENDVADP